MKTLYALALLAIAVVPAFADIYSNGPINGTIGGYAIFGQSISDSFVLSSASIVTGVDFGVWTAPANSVTSVQWSIGTTPGDSSLGGGVAATTDTFLFNNGTAVDSDTFSTGSISLGAGTYYLTLQNSTTTGPANSVGFSEAFWDINNGPSSAFYDGNPVVTLGAVEIGGANSEQQFGSTGSNAFGIQGTTGTVTPEPGSYAALILGFGGVMLVVRSRRSQQHK